MRDRKSSAIQGDTILSSPVGVPSPFTITIREASAEKQSATVFDITGSGSASAMVRGSSYQLHQRDHKAYQDLFEKLADDFGLRMPNNRVRTARPAFGVEYTAVLKHNLAPGMIYGYGDPAVTRVEATGNDDPWYYLVSTSNDAPDSFPIIRSKNLSDWEFSGYVFPRGQKPAWAIDGVGTGDFWAPELHLVQNEFRVYFVARHKDTGELCIGVARSPQPSGPFIPDPVPVLQGNRIDPHVFVAENGTAYLYWKEDNNDVWPGMLLDLLYAHPSFIRTLFPAKEDQITSCFAVTLWPWAQLLDPMERFQALQIFIETITASYNDFRERLGRLADAQPGSMRGHIIAIGHHMQTPVLAQALSMSGSALVGEQTTIIKNDLAWEAHLVEGMWVTRHAGKFYLFYTGNDFSTTQYGIGVAIADTHLGPYRKMEMPVLQSSASWWAPGHPSLVIGPQGEPHLFFHGYFPGKAGYRTFRALLAVVLNFTEDGVQIRQQ